MHDRINSVTLVSPLSVLTRSLAAKANVITPDTPSPTAQTSTRTTPTPKSLVSEPTTHPAFLGSCNFPSNKNFPAPKKKTKRTKPKDEDEEDEEDEEDDVSDDDDDAAAPEEDDDDEEEEKAKPKGTKPSVAEKDRKVKTTAKTDPVPVVDDDDDDDDE